MPITLPPPPLRRTAAIGASALLGLALAGCGANFEAQTAQPYQPAEGKNVESGEIAIRNMLVIASDDGEGVLHAAVVNTGRTDDTLVAITATPSAAQAQAADQPAQPGAVSFGNVRPMTLTAGASLRLPPPSGQPFTVSGGRPGAMIPVTVTFAKAAPVTTSIPVLTVDHYKPTPRDDAAESHD